jgi:hypothetical protein
MGKIIILTPGPPHSFGFLSTPTLAQCLPTSEHDLETLKSSNLSTCMYM